MDFSVNLQDYRLKEAFTINLFCDLFDVLQEHEKTINDILYISIDNKNFKPQKNFRFIQRYNLRKGLFRPLDKSKS